ncbi:hypothetical protein [Paremcibacter congregatus]|uniref:hypothetical protein n=1 Tax=Paremcibacter congregatus TaxID=2043170 RepID=UPI0030EECE50|tara:strand:- start:20436 stop:21080 length:645 start_codon:yes stop_codon:yes gene_type:complete
MIKYSTFNNAADPLAPGKVYADIFPNARYMACVSASHDFLISLNGGAFATFKTRRDLLATKEITSLKIKNPHAVDDLVVDFVFSDGEVKINLQDVTVDNLPAVQDTNIQNWPLDPITGTFVPEILDGGASPPDQIINAGTGAVISALRASKRQTMIYNPTVNTGNFRVGPGAAGGAGILLEPGMSITLDGSMAISAYNEGASNEALTVTELDKS